MIKTLVVDDEEKARSLLVFLLREEAPEIGEIREAANGAEALNVMREFKPDLVFLDVEMPVMNGFDLLTSLDAWDFDIIFTTAYDQYAIRAIRFSALDYLMKPVDPDELRLAVDRFLSKQQTAKGPQYRNLINNLQPGNGREMKLAIPTTDGVYFYRTDEIIRCEADSNYTMFYLTQNRKFLCAKTLKEFDELLTEHGFIRVHKSHLINIRYVENYLGKGSVRMQDKTEILVARRRKEEVKTALMGK
ncbi:MAG TPA: LytTR family DNA-binding domain-containing protein [Flavilitoribacter sp.]|nr:LytTR family DNA-binding domain-containing protein [Flavilitoribacter sp.]